MKPFLFAFLSCTFMIGSLFAQSIINIRTADLESGGYSIMGKAFLEELDNCQLQLRLSDDFDTPPGPDVQIYLANDDRSISGGVQIADIGTDPGGMNHFNGALTLPVPSGVDIEQFAYVVFYCVDFNLQWASGNFGDAEASEGNEPGTYECKESLTATTNWVSEVTVCTNDGQADIIPLKNSIGESAGDNYAFIITDINDLILEVVYVDAYDFEGSGDGVNKVYGVSYDSTLTYNIGDHYTSISASVCATVSDASVFLTINKESCRASIQGRITTHTGAGAGGFEVFLNDTIAAVSNSDGYYTFDNLETGVHYSVAPRDNRNTSSGINTRDLLFIRKHLLGIEEFTSDIQLIAADVSNNGKISTGDLLQVQRIILGLDDDFQDNQSFRFISVSELSQGNIDLNSFTEEISISNLENDQQGIDFVVIKIGDVSILVNN